MYDYKEQVLLDEAEEIAEKYGYGNPDKNKDVDTTSKVESEDTEDYSELVNNEKKKKKKKHHKNKDEKETVTNVYLNVDLNEIFNGVLTFAVFALILWFAKTVFGY